MKKSLLFLGMSLVMLSAQAQSYVGNSPGSGMEMNTRPLGAVQEIDLREFDPKIQHHYLAESWVQGEIHLKGGQTIADYPIRFDLLNNVMEIKTQNQVKVLPGFKIDKFTALNQLGNQDVYVLDVKTTNSTPVKGVFKVVEEGKPWHLLQKASVKILPPNYNKVLDAGSEKEKKVLEYTYYFYDGTYLVEVERSKKKMAEQFPDHLQQKVVATVKEHKLSLKNEEDLIKLATELNK